MAHVDLDANAETDEQLARLIGFDFGDPDFPEDVAVGQARNAYRASRSAYAVVAYAERCGTTDEPLEMTVRDLLSDLMHLADLFGPDWPFPAVLQAAARAYDLEQHQ